MAGLLNTKTMVFGVVPSPVVAMAADLISLCIGALSAQLVPLTAHILFAGRMVYLIPLLVNTKIAQKSQ